MHKQNYIKPKKTCKKQQFVLEFQIIFYDLRSHIMGLFPKHIISRTMFPYASSKLKTQLFDLTQLITYQLKPNWAIKSKHLTKLSDFKRL
jgi:hypothetical protein